MCQGPSWEKGITEECFGIVRLWHTEQARPQLCHSSPGHVFIMCTSLRRVKWESSVSGQLAAFICCCRTKAQRDFVQKRKWRWSHNSYLFQLRQALYLPAPRVKQSLYLIGLRVEPSCLVFEPWLPARVRQAEVLCQPWEVWASFTHHCVMWPFACERKELAWWQVSWKTAHTSIEAPGHWWVRATGTSLVYCFGHHFSEIEADLRSTLSHQIQDAAVIIEFANCRRKLCGLWVIYQLAKSERCLGSQTVAMLHGGLWGSWTSLGLPV